MTIVDHLLLQCFCDEMIKSDLTLIFFYLSNFDKRAQLFGLLCLFLLNDDEAVEVFNYDVDDQSWIAPLN